MRIYFILLFVLTAAFLLAENWTYEIQTIELPTGTEENEIFIYETPDHLNDARDEGPTKFQIDDDNIYVLDSKTIKKFDMKGKFQCSSQETDLLIASFVVHQNMIYTVCSDYQNNVLLRRFDDNCQLIDTHQIENRKSILSVNQNGKVGLNLGNNNFLEFNFGNNNISTTNGALLNDTILDFSSRDHNQKVLFPEENKVIDLFEVWPNEIGHTLIGFDKERNLYFNIYSKPLENSSLGIISESGEVIETNVIFPHYTEFGLNFALGISNHVIPDGTIYQMIPMKDKIEIRKWTKAGSE